ncbi:tubulin-folding cofactor B-like [Haliotis rubra]|uniref:tubulin-folding cofactor B-like n=1 Tax=Haliotis rubra TaxID=36100 RepID=UPI001EE5570F|nr:tubulin-folding cofactor B-like [Haliotis rubra]
MSEGGYQVITQSVVNVRVTSNVNTFGSERRFQKDLTISDLKNKIELLTGASSGTMKLSLNDKDNKMVCQLDNEAALLGSYPVEDNMIIHVEDKSLILGEYEDVSKVKKYEMTAEDYSKRSDSVRSFKERNKLGRFDPEEQARKQKEMQQKDEEEKARLEEMKIGDRCEVQITGQPTRRGTVKYLGDTDFKPGLWVGVQYDEPHGKNDGSVSGKQYFSCQPKYGGFVKPLNVKVGDFPEEDFGLSDEEM